MYQKPPLNVDMGESKLINNKMVTIFQVIENKTESYLLHLL